MIKGVRLYVRILLGVLIMFLCFELYVIVYEQVYLKYSHILPLILLVFLLAYRNKITLLIMLVVCIYGVFDIIKYGNTTSFSTSMDFTSSLNYFIFSGKNGSFVKRILGLVPLFVYLTTFFIFLTNPLKVYYNNIRGEYPSSPLS